MDPPDSTQDYSYPPILQTYTNMSVLQDKDIHVSKVAVPSGGDIQSVFWTKYKEAATKHDNEVMKRHNRDMDVILIFSGLFSAVDTAFIIAGTRNSDPRHVTNALWAQFILGDAGVVNATSTFALGGGVIFEALAYASLSFCLLAAFGATLGKQWIAHYRTTSFGHGSLEERCMQRQQKFDALTAWHFEAVLQSFPVLLQISIMFLGLALSTTIWTQHPLMSSAVIAMTAVLILLVTRSLSSTPLVLPTAQPRSQPWLSSS